MSMLDDTSDGAVEAAPADILLIDDRPGNLRYLRYVLQSPAHQLWQAESAEAALLEIRRREFAVVVLDMALPDMDGFDVVRHIRNDERSGDTPILLVTADLEPPRWAITAPGVGAVDFMREPLDLHVLRAKVAFFVQLFHQKKQLARLAQLLRESERRARELGLGRTDADHERRFRVLAEALPEAIWTASPDGQMEYFNHRWYQTTGLGEAQSLGEGWLSVVHPEDAPRVASCWRAAVDSGSKLQVEFRLQTVTGAHRWRVGRAVPLQGVGQDCGRWFGAFTDIDEQKRADEQARAALRVRDDFISIVSHELRSPVTLLQLEVDSLTRQLEGLGEGSVERRFSQRLNSVSGQVERLSSLVESLLDVSRIATGQLTLNRDLLDLSKVVSDVAERWRDAASRVGCELRCVGQGPLLVSWDSLRLEQVLTNLLSNAIKYAPGKPIDLVLEGTAEAVRLSVCDRGVGIPAADLSRIFNRFERAMPKYRSGGLGLGLYVARQIVEAHGATLEASSEPGVGSTFNVIFPLSKQSPASPSAQ